MNKDLDNLANHCNGMSVIDINAYKNNVFRSRHFLSSTYLHFLFDCVMHNSRFEFTHLYENIINVTRGHSNKRNVSEMKRSSNMKSEDFLGISSNSNAFLGPLSNSDPNT